MLQLTAYQQLVKEIFPVVEEVMVVPVKLEEEEMMAETLRAYMREGQTPELQGFKVNIYFCSQLIYYLGSTT